MTDAHPEAHLTATKAPDAPPYKPYLLAETMPTVAAALHATDRSVVAQISRLVRFVAADFGESKAVGEPMPRCLAAKLRSAERAALAFALALEEVDQHVCKRCDDWGPIIKGQPGANRSIWSLADPQQ
jgi:hypothetical protein